MQGPKIGRRVRKSVLRLRFFFGFFLEKQGDVVSYLEGMTSFTALRDKLGGLFLWGFEGTRISSAFRSLLRRSPPAGVILFKRNLESLKQVRELTGRLNALGGPSLLIGVDEEGGRVSRMPEPFVKFPPAAEWGEIYRKGRDPEILFHAGRFLASELRAAGINTDFAPVLDVHSNPRNPIIGDRAFSRDPKIAAEAAVAFCRGMIAGGVIPCGKHFPGHGDTSTDSHLTLPCVKRPKSSLEKTELLPFRMAIRKGIPMLMTAHVVYEAWDRERPATLSKKILQDLLRKKLGFRGVIISDDLQMKAVSDRCSLVELILQSLEAGVDIPLVCRGGEEGGEVLEKVARVVSSNSALQGRVQESLRRVTWLKRKYLK